MVPRILLCLTLLSPSGCAYMASRQTCNITSNPSGASVFVINSLDEQTAGKLLGTTPCQKWIQQGLTAEYLRADLEGYESAVWPLPHALRFSHHFELERAVSAQVAEELATYPKEYVRAALDVLGKCDAVMASPGMLSGAAAASANTANEGLKLDYSDFRTSALARALDRTIDELRHLGGLPSSSYDTSTERGAAARAQHLINEIKQALGVR
jgi:hypothetical protein